jgi:RNA polymerase sigma-70 factor (ECF subfamily)
MTRDSETTWRKAAADDAEAFRRIVEAYDDRLIRACQALCGDQDIADEAVQATWIIAWRKLETVRDETRVAGWLTVVALNETRRLLRDRKRRSFRERLSHVAGLVRAARTPQELDVASALQLLSAQDQAILVLRYVEDRPSDEVGRMMGMPAATVRTRTRRALNSLRKELGGDVG